MVSKNTGRRAFLAGVSASLASLSGCLRTAGSVFDSPPTTGATVDGTFHESLVVFRNDDLAPWTDLDVLRGVDDVFTEQNVPITHGIITRDIKSDEELGADHRLCEYLTDLADKRENQVGYAVHGRTHVEETDFHGGSEFGGLQSDEQRRRIEAATQALENCLGSTPRVFIPPYKTYDEQTVEALQENDFSLVSGGAEFQAAYFDKQGFWRDEGLLHLPMNLPMEDWGTESVRDITALRSEFDENRMETSLNVVALHYYFYDNAEARQTLADIAEYAADSDGVCMTLNEFARKATAGDIERLDDGWMITG